ncbi:MULTISPECIES: beta-ketoacyl-ACP synthase [Methylomonas]|uniref:beta-ketoacyl-ACP synthase n=1 Tax=Methylomonas TaxID=416 RepID=UPI001E2B3E91|nr:beta-ketoacyl-ACP synthase [Methylomonas rhizoryzae]
MMRAAAYLHDVGIVSALGCDKPSVLQAWLDGRAPQPQTLSCGEASIPAMAVQAELPRIPPRLNRYDCRNNRLLLAALGQIEAVTTQAIARYGPHRIGIVLGTSTSGIAEGERAIAELLATGIFPESYHYSRQELGGAAEFLAEYLRIAGPAYTLSTTCSSSANALLSARRLLRLGACDAVLVGGSDSLCRTTLQGFSVLAAISRTRCLPFSANRDGTVLGEGAALFMMSREPAPFVLSGGGASADAYHISAPRPDGSGALAAMQAALSDAGLSPRQIEYLNLHGTATVQNDAMEALAVHALFGTTPPCGSSKQATGHCLGAAGAIEAALCWLLLSEFNPERRLPAHRWDGQADPTLPSLNFVAPGHRCNQPLQYCLSNSFSFGGNNVSLLLGKSELL